MSTAMRLLHTALEQHLGDVVLAGVARHVQQGLAIDQLVDMVRGQVLFDLSLIGALDGLLDGANVSRLAEESQFRKTTRDQRTHRSCYNGRRSRRPRATSKTRETTAMGVQEREREREQAGRRGTAERERHAGTGRYTIQAEIDRSNEREQASNRRREKRQSDRSNKRAAAALALLCWLLWFLCAFSGHRLAMRVAEYLDGHVLFPAADADADTDREIGRVGHWLLALLEDWRHFHAGYPLTGRQQQARIYLRSLCRPLPLLPPPIGAPVNHLLHSPSGRLMATKLPLDWPGQQEARGGLVLGQSKADRA